MQYYSWRVRWHLEILAMLAPMAAIGWRVWQQVTLTVWANGQLPALTFTCHIVRSGLCQHAVWANIKFLTLVKIKIEITKIGSDCSSHSQRLRASAEETKTQWLHTKSLSHSVHWVSSLFWVSRYHKPQMWLNSWRSANDRLVPSLNCLSRTRDRLLQVEFDHATGPLLN